MTIKYVAINDFTGIQVKTFRTRWGARRWYKRPVMIMGEKFSKAGLFISIYGVTSKDEDVNKYFFMKILHEIFIKKMSLTDIQEKHKLSDDQMKKIYDQLQEAVSEIDFTTP